MRWTTTAGQCMDQGFRFEPITPDPERVVLRPRLTKLLAGRFDMRVTTVVGVAGSGKSTALSLAIADNQLDPIGRDVWLGLTTTDNEPTHLLAGIAASLGVDAQADDRHVVRQIYDAVWSLAPVDIAIHLDDAHLITSAGGLAAITSLVHDLPGNGHLVLVSRSPLDIPLARWRSQNLLLEVTEQHLDLQPDEVSELRTRYGHDEPATDAPRHIATAELQIVAGSDAGVEFLWQEILSRLDPDRLKYLRRAAPLDAFDDPMVRELTDGAFDATALVDGLPLVERHGQSAIRMHHILRDALLTGLDEGEGRKGLEVAASLALRNDQHAEAVSLYHLAGNDIAARDAARDYVMVPTLTQSMADVATIDQVISTIAPRSALRLAIEASQRFDGLETHVTTRFVAMAEVARNEGDDRLEALALHRILQAAFIGLAELSDAHVRRVHELAATSPFAGGVEAHMMSQLLQRSGDTAGAVAELDRYHLFGSASEIVLRAERWCDLGHPEQVGVGMSPDDLGELAAGSEIFVAFAMWLRGEAPPDMAEAVVAEMLPTVVRRGVTHPSISILGVGTSIALAAGEIEKARRRASHARELCALGVGSQVTEFAHVAAASIAAVVDGDQAAAKLLDPEVTGTDLRAQTQRAHFLALPLIYLTRPESRRSLDEASFGPALTTAVNAGRALVELRESGSTQAASRLPWSNSNLLRAHVLPPHLAELACAAADRGHVVAREVLMDLPDLARNLARVETASAMPARRHAVRMLARLPPKPRSKLTAALLGPVILERNGEQVRDDGWVRRGRVRELCAVLLEQRRVERGELLSVLWPDYADQQRAQASLRTSLSTLQRVLEPGRPAGTEPFFLRSNGDTLTMDPALTTDVDRFDELMAEALSEDRAGLPASALSTLESALALYRGDYLEGLNSAWAIIPRLRLRSLAINGMCRLAELTGARGEPERAARWAARAHAIDPLDQRAARLFISALDAGGHTLGARDAATDLGALLLAEGLEFEHSTTRLFDRLGV